MTLRPLRGAASARCCCGLLGWQPGARRRAIAAATVPRSFTSTPTSFLRRSLPVFSTAVAAPLRCFSSAAAPAERPAQPSPAPASASAAADTSTPSDSSTSGSPPKSQWFQSNVFALDTVRDTIDPLQFAKVSHCTLCSSRSSTPQQQSALTAAACCALCH